MRKRAFAALAMLILGVFTTRLASAQQQDDPQQQPPPYDQQQAPDAQQQPPYNQQVPYPQQQPPNGQPPNGQPPNGQQPNGQQPGNPSQPDTDAGAARVSFVRGDVSMQRGDTGDTSAVTLNTPLMSGDKISTGDAARAEVQLDFASVLRLDDHAQVNIVTLTRSRIQIQLAQGLVNYSTVRPSEADVEIDTPNVSIHPQRQAHLHIQVNATGDTEVIVRDGTADVSTAQGSTQVHRGDLITIQGAGDQAQYRVSAAPANDEWDSWNGDRDRIITNAQSFQHTNPYYTGSQDLDQYGVWSEVPNYGQVWTPTVAAGWAPYRAGRWVWEPYYGWTWVSLEPWGWAPYHYGRWFLAGGRWAWWPGPVYVGYRPLWAPAYVSFFGFGGGVGFGFGFGSVGWLAIGPGDFFHPWWGGFRGGFGVVDIHNAYNIRGGIAPLHAGGGFSNLRDLATNDSLRGGMSSMSTRNFGTGVEPVRGVSAENLRSARAVTGTMPLSASRASMRVSDRPANSQAFSAHANQHFYSSGSAGGGARGFQGQAAAGGFNRGASSASPSGGWQRFSGGASAAGGAGSGQQSYRPPLNLNRPIVNENQRTNGGSVGAPAGGSSSGNRGGNPGAYSGNRGTSGGYSPAPSYRGAPSGNTSPNGSYRSAPSTNSRSASAPSYRGAPSGGSSRSGGGSRGGGSRGGSRGGGRR